MIHHVQISVPLGSLEDAIDFYTGVMGFEELERPVSLQKIEGCWLAIGQQQIHIRTRANHPRESKEHVAYQVNDLDEWRANILKANLMILESIPIAGMDRFEFRDPFDNRIEMLCLR